MPFIGHQMVGDVQMLARQAISTTASTIISSAIAASSPPTTTTGSPVPNTSAAPSPTSSVANGKAGSNPDGNGNGGGDKNSPNSSPLLFFVALGFGVVFTNLWIIVGVKYCFRYNARNRAMRMNEDGEPINLENMPRPHRRRREKKLMTMDEVNEKFPMQKYKSWVASRAQEGLPTRGGVSSPQDVAESVRDADGVVPELPSKERESTEERPTTSATTTNATREPQDPSHQTKDTTSNTEAAQPPPASTEPDVPPTVTDTAAVNEAHTLPKPSPSPHHDDDDDEDDEHINAALPPECMGTAGDTCAICIDGLEDDDDVRGLSCGHAFHAGCLDPWLTSRRACCPLCKADYYTPKPRAPTAEPGEGMGSHAAAAATRDGRRANMPTRPPGAWGGIRGHGRMLFPTRFGSANRGEDLHRSRSQPQSPPTSGGRGFFWGRSRQPQVSSEMTSPTTSARGPPVATDPPPQGRFATFRSAFPPFRTAGRTAPQASSGPVASGAITEPTTPSNLEAGVRPPQYG